VKLKEEVLEKVCLEVAEAFANSFGAVVQVFGGLKQALAMAVRGVRVWLWMAVLQAGF